MVFFKLAFKSIKNRRFSTLLTILSIALSVSLLLSVEKVKRAAQDGFTQTISKTDLIVGARGGPMQLLLYSVFNMGNATNNISYETYQEIAKNPLIEWTIPYSLGDGHKGFRVVGTTEDFFVHYHYRGSRKVELAQGRVFEDLWDVVVGAEVASKYNYKLGDKIVISHGVTKEVGVQHHDEKPFVISGILAPTGTPLDRAVYVCLEGVEALHLDWDKGAAPQPNEIIPKEKILKNKIKVDEITSFFVGTKSRIQTLQLQRELNEFGSEPLTAIIPAVVLNELWTGLSYIEIVLKFTSWMVIAVGFIGMLIALTTTLNERRREMAIFRAIGATSGHIVGLLVFESALLSIWGLILGWVISWAFFFILRPWIEFRFGLYLSSDGISLIEIAYLIMTFAGGTLIGFIPALRAQRLALKDGLSVKT